MSVYRIKKDGDGYAPYVVERNICIFWWQELTSEINYNRAYKKLKEFSRYDIRKPKIWENGRLRYLA